MRRTIRSGYAGTTTNIQIVLNTPKNPFLNQATEKILAKISYPQKPGVDHFKPPQNRSITTVTILAPRVRRFLVTW